jgi:outer membrane protein TolC
VLRSCNASGFPTRQRPAAQSNACIYARSELFYSTVQADSLFFWNKIGLVVSRVNKTIVRISSVVSYFTSRSGCRFALQETASRLVLCCALAALISACAVRPEPITTAESATFTESRLTRIATEQERVTHAISLYEAMARAIKFNLDTRVEQAQAALRLKELDLSHYKMLPSLVANSGYIGRDNVSASSSRSIETGRQSLEPSTSTERNMLSSDLTFSWNILDFGLSYFRAQQLADEALIAEETRRRVANRVIEDVRTAYWRAVTSERLASRMRGLEARVQTAMRDARRQYNDASINPVAAISYERDLVEVRRQIQQVDADLAVAKSQLAALMNLTPGTPFRLVDSRGASVPTLNRSPAEMIRIAVNNRPEMREVQYRLRINDKESTAALLELLPGAQLYLGGNYDSNKFLFNNNWLAYGAKASWNLLKIAQYPARKASIDAQDTMLDQRSMALTMAIMTQVHVSRARYGLAYRDLKTAADMLNVQNKLRAQIRSQIAVDKSGEQLLIKEELNALLAEVRFDLAHAQLQNAFASVYGALGLDPVDSTINVNAETTILAKQLEQLWRKRGDGMGVRAVNMIQPVRVRAYTPSPLLSQLLGQPPMAVGGPIATGTVQSHPVPEGRTASHVIGPIEAPAKADSILPSVKQP